MKKALQACIAFAVGLLILGNSMPALASVAIEGGVEVENPSEEQTFVPENLTWPQEALDKVPGIMQGSVTKAQSLIDQLKADGASSITITSGERVNEIADFTRYKDLDVLNHSSTLIGRGDWAVEVGRKLHEESATADWSASLVGFEPGICRLSWALFNWDTWFSSDCRVISATPEQYLRIALASSFYYSDALDDGPSYEVSSALQQVSEYQLSYTIKNGMLFAPELETDWGFAESGIPLNQAPSEGSGGYKIQVDANDAYRFVIVVVPPAMQALASRARVIEDTRPDGTKAIFVRFN